MKKFSVLSALLLCLVWIAGYDGSSAPAQSNQRDRALLLVQNGTIGIRGRIGFHVAEVGAAGPAARAGLKTGDLILEVNGRSIQSEEDVRTTILDILKPPGQKYRIKLLRFNSQTSKYETTTIEVTSDVYVFPKAGNKE